MMLLFLKDIQSNVNHGLLLVYGLIAFVILLIAVILIIDKIHHKKEESLFHSRHLKNRLRELQVMESEKRLETRSQERKEKQEEFVSEPPKEVIEEITATDEVEPEKDLEVESHQEIIETSDLKMEEAPVREEPKSVVPEINPLKKESITPSKVQEDLEKTQAQIEVEEITKALEKAVQEEQELNKYAKFEEEQEQNAIISYAELKGKFDELYEESEKTQYVNDDTIPINLKELYETNELIQAESQRKPSVPVVEDPPVEAVKPLEKKPGEFRNSPIISPVYGIQKDDFQIKKEVSKTSREDLQTTTDFLNTLKELQKNLD